VTTGRLARATGQDDTLDPPRRRAAPSLDRSQRRLAGGIGHVRLAHRRRARHPGRHPPARPARPHDL